MHADPELLSLLALGEQVGSDEERAHVLSCLTCAAEVAALGRLVTLARGIDDDIELAAPSPEVWSRIRQELALPPPVSVDRRDQDAGPAAGTSRRSLATVLADAWDGSASTPPATVAHAVLTPVQGEPSDRSGEAVITTDRIGRRILQLVLDADSEGPTIRHAWLVDRADPVRRHSLGMLDGPFGVWTVDRSIDLGQFAVLDISEQDHDGRADRSVVTGEFVLVG